VTTPDFSPAPPGLDVVFSDEYLVVLNKFSGLLCVPGRGSDKQDCLSARAQARFADALIVHRLDMATSGLVLMARDMDMQRRLSAAFANREVYKRYEAVVHGYVDAPHDQWRTIDLPIGVDWLRRPLRVIDPVSGKPSVSRVRLLGTNPENGSSRVALELETGRTHQLRVHLQAIGHPILGDTLYAPAEVAAAASRLNLHACELRFDHPALHQTCEFLSAAPF
jgi:tRNA pseudouridine32 synthase/23S rRNA pseudouridine746 synthase